MLSQKYHDIFDYPLVKSDYPRWKHVSDKSIKGVPSIKSIKREKREKISIQKLIIAKKASKILAKIPTVKFIGVTGALSMMNAGKDSDIDLMIITKENTLWSTRFFVLVILLILQIPVRRANKRDEKNKLCLNMWMDESDLTWNKNDRNIYTAHEIAQIVPLVNKNKTYEKFIFLNRWVLDHWPISVKIKDSGFKIYENIFSHKSYIINHISLFIEQSAFRIQYQYMKSKITREVIRPTRAIFHPNDWGKKVLAKLSS